MLRDRPLTVALVEDAWRLAAGDGSPFAEAINRVAENMRTGYSLAQCLMQESHFFDPLFCVLVSRPDGRDALCAVLARLGGISSSE